MALSKPEVSDSVHEEPIIGQDYLMCDNEGCEKNCQFYCNHCHLRVCKQCKNEHQKSLETQNHEVVTYTQRKRQLPVEKCKNHPTKNIDMLCEDCQIPVCSKCATKNHRKHALNDLETIYSDKFTLCLDEIYKIYQYFLPTSHDKQEKIRENFKEIQATMDKIRTSITAESESLKRLVDTVASDKIEQVNNMEESLKKMLKSQDKTYQDYISYLEDLVKQFHGYMSSTKVQNNPLIFSRPDQLKIQPIPETTKPVPPVFTAGQYIKEDVTKLLGRVTVPYNNPGNRNIKPMETASSELKPTEKQRKEDRKKSDEKQTPSPSTSVTKVREYTVPGVDSVHHISLGKSGRLWGSDDHGNLVKTDLQGSQLQKIQTNGGYGYHTVTQDGDLIFTDRKKNVLRLIKEDKKNPTEVIKTGVWEPISIHSSHINGDILVGMIKNGEAKVTRYNKTGGEIQSIQRDNTGRAVYGTPRYITENINGDICTSDYNKDAVVVVNKSGQHRFSYTGQGLRYPVIPSGICTDLFGHILVCNIFRFGIHFNFRNHTVHLLDQDGQFLSELLTLQNEIEGPKGLCVDNENNLYVGQWDKNTVKVYKYLQ